MIEIQLKPERRILKSQTRFLNPESWILKGPTIQRFKGPKDRRFSTIPRSKDPKVQRCKGPKEQRFNDAEKQRYKGSKVQLNEALRELLLRN